MIFALSLLFVAAAVVDSQGPPPVPVPVAGRDYRVNPYYDESPKPYAFSYNALLDDGVGQSSRTETADGSGRVQGSYSLTNDEGHSRVVEYVADQDGFRATVRTNEPGTDNKNPADVIIESAGPYSDRPYSDRPYADRPYQYNPVGRRPVVNAPPQPGAPAVPVVPAAPGEPVDVAPENVIPARRPDYRRPGYPNRNNLYRQPVRNPYIRY